MKNAECKMLNTKYKPFIYIMNVRNKFTSASRRRVGGKNLCVLLMIAGLPLAAFSQDAYWQQEVHYNINVALNDKQHSLKGDLSAEYINHSPERE